MILSRIWTAAALMALVACGDRPAKPVDITEALPNIPLPPSPTIVSRAGGVNTAMITLRSPAKIADVQAYYRAVLSGPGWKLVKQSTDRSGAIIMLAEQDGPPLWVRLRSAPDGSGTLVDLAGAVVDSVSAKGAS